MLDAYDNITARLRASGEYLWPLVLRLVMFWEFWEAGTKKLNGSNWFADIIIIAEGSPDLVDCLPKRGTVRFLGATALPCCWGGVGIGIVLGGGVCEFPLGEFV